MAKVPCIYKIINSSNGKFYIGSSVDFLSRKNRHLSDLRSGNHCNSHLQKAYDKYSENSFNFEILEIINTPNILIYREQFYLDLLKPYDEHVGYNISKIAGSWLGNHHSESTKKILSEKNTGYKHTMESKELMKSNSPRLSGGAHPMYGRKHSYESIEMMKISNNKISGILHPMFGKKWDDEHLNNFKEKSTGENNPMFGISLVDIWKEKYGQEIAIHKWTEANRNRSLNCLNKGIKPVIQKTISGKLIAEYISITEAGNKTNINLGSITQVCKGNRKNAGGYKWEYKNNK